MRMGQRVGRAAAAIALTAALPAAVAPPAAAGIDGEVVYARSTDAGRNFGERSNLSVDTDKSELAHVAAGDGVAHVTWKRGEEGDIVYRRTAGRDGRFVGPQRNLSRSEGDSSEPDLALADDGVAVVWAEAVASGEDEVFRVSSPDAGRTFGTRTAVSATPERSSRDPDIAAGGALVAVAYEEGSDDDEDVFVARSVDGGERFARPVNVSRDANRAVEATVALSGSLVHVAWEARGDDLDAADDRVAYARSTDGGATFSAPSMLRARVALRRPAIAADGDIVHLVACSPGDKSGLFASDAYYSRSTDRGATWSAPVNLSKNPGDCSNPAVATARGKVYVAWTDSTPGRSDILLRRSGNGGRAFDRSVNLSASPGDSEDASLAVDSSTGDVHAVWTDFSVAPGAAPKRDDRRR